MRSTLRFVSVGFRATFGVAGTSVMMTSLVHIVWGGLIAAGMTSAFAQTDAIRFVDSTDARIRSPATHFAIEYARINGRRRHYGFPFTEGSERPPEIVGLALSGGGIRSNAFQLGLLSGLYAEKVGEARLLDRIDYVSSVSGGSWANAALWAWPNDLGQMFNCLDNAAASGKSSAVRGDGNCADVVGMLRTHQSIPVVSMPDHQRKEEWQRDIVRAYLPRGCDVSFSATLPPECAANLVTKPYPIINSTHSARTESPGVDGFPFETTPDGAGTVVDEGSKRPGLSSPRGESTGFFLDFHQPDVRWTRREFFAARIPGGRSGLVDGSTVSLAAAHSSAVIKGPLAPAMFLTFYYQVSKDDGARYVDRRLRNRYKLTDGGKSENTGAFALLDRGVDVLVISYMGKEASPFEDFDVTRGQAKNLFGCEMADVNKTQGHPRAQEAYFVCPKAPNPAPKPTLHVHPWSGNIADFLRYLDAQARAGDSGAAELLAFLEDDQRSEKEADRFPQTPTFRTNYDERLIRAYYLLGKFTARADIVPFLRKQLAIQ